MRAHPSDRPLLPLPGDETDLTALAMAARAGDPTARNRLFAMLAEPIGACIRSQRSLCNALEPDEVTSESFLALADLLAVWPDVPFPAFFQDLYGVCLRQRLRTVQPPPQRWLSVDRAAWFLTTPPAAVPPPATVRLTRDLPSATLTLLEGRADGISLAALAPHLGISPRQAQRRWRALVDRVARSTPARPGPSSS